MKRREREGEGPRRATQGRPRRDKEVESSLCSCSSIASACPTCTSVKAGHSQSAARGSEERQTGRERGKHRSQDALLAALLHLARDDELVEDLHGRGGSSVAMPTLEREERTHGVGLLVVEDAARGRQRSAPLEEDEDDEARDAQVELADVAKVPVEHLDVAVARAQGQRCSSVRGRARERERGAPVDDLERDELVVLGADAAHEEQARVAAIHDLGVCGRCSLADERGRGGGARGGAPLYSRKLHMRVRRARTSWVTSFTILAVELGGERGG